MTADVLATAIVGGDQRALHDMRGRWPIDVLAIDRGGALMATRGFREAIAA